MKLARDFIVIKYSLLEHNLPYVGKKEMCKEFQDSFFLKYVIHSAQFLVDWDMFLEDVVTFNNFKVFSTCLFSYAYYIWHWCKNSYATE
jgi:hypothetical protein